MLGRNDGAFVDGASGTGNGSGGSGGILAIGAKGTFGIGTGGSGTLVVGVGSMGIGPDCNGTSGIGALVEPTGNGTGFNTGEDVGAFDNGGENLPYNRVSLS